MPTRFSFLLFCFALTASALPAQEIASLLPGPQRSTPARFSLSPAGARALGLGGAFVAVADDATAADANPAGLSRLDGPELLMSLRWSELDTEFEGGLADRTTTSESVAGPAFVGYAHPLGRLTLAGYYQQDGRYESGDRFESLGDRTVLLPFPPLLVDERRYDQTLETLGAAAGFRLGPAVSIGGALRYQRLSLGWLSELLYDYQVIGDNFAPDPFAPVLVGFRDVVDDRGSDVSAVLGLLVHPEGRWTGGLSYQQGGDFELAGTLTFLYAPNLPGWLGLIIPEAPREARLALPDVLSAGVAFRPRERWLLSAQLSHLTYSDLQGEPVAFPEIFPFIGAVPLFYGDEPIDDATQIHLGAEVRLGSPERPITLRAGAWSDPDHDPVRGIDGDQIHVALGAGTVLGGRFGLDGALRASETVTEGVLALIYRM